MITSAIGAIIDGNGNFTNDDEQISSILNTFFTSLFIGEDLSDMLTVTSVQIDNNDVLRRISVAERCQKVSKNLK